MILEPNTDGVPVRTLASKGGGLGDPTSVGEGNRAFLIRVWNLSLADAFSL